MNLKCCDMNTTDLILISMLACTFILCFGIILIRKDIEELRELINKKL